MDVIHERPVKRRKIVVSAIIGAIPMAVLALFFFFSIALMIWGEDGTDPYINAWTLYSTLGFFWLLWGIVFYKSYASENPIAFTSCITRWLLRGSILEMLVAIPSHIISRQREECCAPPITLIGIATGLAVALMSFGPGILFLYAQRIKSKKGKPLNNPNPTSE
jgi:ABC-type transport system involved in multi-copper enzyme maturation permease subunit